MKKHSWKSTKFWQTVVGEVGLIIYLIKFAPHDVVIYVVAGIVTLALGYNVANAWLGRAVAKNGKTPEA